MEVVASLSQGRTAAAQCGMFTYKSVPVIFEPPCINKIMSVSDYSHARKMSGIKTKINHTIQMLRLNTYAS